MSKSCMLKAYFYLHLATVRAQRSQRTCKHWAYPTSSFIPHQCSISSDLHLSIEKKKAKIFSESDFDEEGKIRLKKPSSSNILQKKLPA